LTVDQLMRLQEYVGQERASLFDGFFSGPKDLPSDPEITRRQLQRIWDQGQHLGKAEFLAEVPVESLNQVNENGSLMTAVNPYR